MERLKYLIDTNVFLELLLGQKKALDVRQFFRKVESVNISLSDFSLHSIGIILLKLKKGKSFIDFIDDLILTGGVQILSLYPEDMLKLIEVAKRYGLDFDDAYQYIVAEKFSLKIVSFDVDFDKTEKGRQEPVALL